MKVAEAAVKVSEPLVRAPSVPLSSLPVEATIRSTRWSPFMSASATAVVLKLPAGKSVEAAAVNVPVPSLR